jgi:putative hemolysin
MANPATEKFIDLERVISSKNPTLARLIPRFALNYMKRIIHVDEINDFIASHKNSYGLEFVEAVLREFKATIKYEGLENVPATSRFIVVANHPLGGLDGLALISVMSKVRKDLIFPVNDLLMNLENLRELFIPVNKHGTNAENIRIFEETFASDTALLYFPAGLCSRKQSGQIMDVEWKKTFLSKARKYKRDIVPVHIDGRNSSFFYNLANIRKRLGIKSNIEMIYLPDEMMKQRNKIISFTIGLPIPIGVFDKRHSDREWAELVKSHVYALGRGEKGPSVFWS